MFRRHSVVPLAPSDRIPSNDLVGCRINDRENVVVLQVYINFAGDRVVLRHSGFAVEMQGFNDLVFGYIDNSFGLPRSSDTYSL